MEGSPISLYVQTMAGRSLTVRRYSGTESCVRNAPDAITIYFSRDISGKLNQNNQDWPTNFLNP